MKYLSAAKRINWRLVAAAFFAVGILHIIATLSTPSLTPSTGYERLATDLPVNTMQVLPPVTAEAQPLPFMGTDARYAVCRFDTADGAVALNATLPGPGWILALYSPEGDNFFSSVAQPGRRRDVSLLLVPFDERFRGEAGETAPASAPAIKDQDPTLTVPARKGIAIIRAPEQGEAYRVRNLAELKRARCTYRRI
jgi:uncharacterized membrane protein